MQRKAACLHNYGGAKKSLVLPAVPEANLEACNPPLPDSERLSKHGSVMFDHFYNFSIVSEIIEGAYQTKDKIVFFIREEQLSS